MPGSNVLIALGHCPVGGQRCPPTGQAVAGRTPGDTAVAQAGHTRLMPRSGSKPDGGLVSLGGGRAMMGGPNEQKTYENRVLEGILVVRDPPEDKDDDDDDKYQSKDDD